jgi:predicted extracellular nuclease
MKYRLTLTEKILPAHLALALLVGALLLVPRSVGAPALCATAHTPVYAIQGSGNATPLAGQIVTTQGVVVGDFQGLSPALGGFYLQDVAGDGDPLTSNGIFVFNRGRTTVSLGSVVRVTGRAEEFQDQTQISATVTGAAIIDCGVTATVEPTDVGLPFPEDEGSVPYLERYEGMLVRLPQTLFVTEHFQLGRFGQVVLSSGDRLYQPTQVTTPGPPALALQAENDRNRIIIDDQLNNQNPDPVLFGRGGEPLTAGNTLRGGDTATGLAGVMTYTWAGHAASGNAYRVRPVGALGGGVPDFQPSNPRPAEPGPVGGSVRVASFNLLNYFNTFGPGNCSAGVGGQPVDCRGAANSLELERQAAKIVAALVGLDADVIGLQELENDGYGPASAIADLVDRLNAATAPGTYAAIDVDAATGQLNALGHDAIKVGFIYRPATVRPVGRTAVLNTGAFGLFTTLEGARQRNRPALAQSFEEHAGGARFTAVVNHFKSKATSCADNISPVGPDPDLGDGQGNCNLTRTVAAQELVAWLATDPTGIGDPDVLTIGDLNAYAREDPVTALTEAGYTDLLRTQAYTFAFSGQWGSLDYALASPTLTPQVAGATIWHINADEPSALSYSTRFKSAGQLAGLYAPDPFRSSDHDPVSVGLALSFDPATEIGILLARLQQHGTGRVEALSITLQQALSAVHPRVAADLLGTFSNMETLETLPSDIATDLIYRAQLIKDALRHLQR